MRFDITYETVTPESAENGDCEESGFYMEHVTLREAWDVLRWEGGHCEASESHIPTARWLTFYGEQCPTTGEHTNYSLHFPSKLSQYSRVRIARLFRCYGVK
jgi:hypothetical protein